jgi:hypothetical protein
MACWQRRLDHVGLDLPGAGVSFLGRDADLVWEEWRVDLTLLMGCGVHFGGRS